MENVKNKPRKSPFVDNYQDYTDKYFSRSKEILEKDGINPLVRYQVFSRKNIYELEGINEAVDFIKGVAGDKVKVYSMKEGEAYIANQPMMKLEGRVQDLVDLETVYLGILSGNLTGNLDFNEIRGKASEIKQVAGEKPVYYFGARHFHPKHDERLARICYEEGFQGTSTDIGAKAWNAKGGGTIPHSLVLAYLADLKEKGIYGNATVEATKAFDKHIDSDVSRYLLNCTFNREITDTIETAKAVPNLKGTRIDTCGENTTQENENFNLPEDLDVPLKYLNGTGVKINGVWGLRRALDEAGLDDLEIVVSSGFNPEKTKAFMQADKKYQEMYEKPLFDSIGTGSLASPVMTTSDIYSYFSEKDGEWKDLSKVGRKELLGSFLEEVQ
jgi:nicotinate phosphoribosyltransferase